jgi:hypothetical protein
MWKKALKKAHGQLFRLPIRRFADESEREQALPADIPVKLPGFLDEELAQYPGLVEKPPAYIEKIFGAVHTIPFESELRKKITIFHTENKLYDPNIVDFQGFSEYLWNFWDDNELHWMLTNSAKVSQLLKVYAWEGPILVNLFGYFLFRGASYAILCLGFSGNELHDKLHSFKPTTFSANCLLAYVSVNLGMVNELTLNNFLSEIKEKVDTGRLEQALKGDVNLIPFLLFVNQVLLGVVKESSWNSQGIPEVLETVKRVIRAKTLKERLDVLKALDKIGLGQTTFTFQKLCQEVYLNMYANKPR